MDRWNNRVALVTGASVGIGAEIAKELVKHGLKVVGCARNEEQLKELASNLNRTGPGQFLARKCDLSKDNEVEEMFSWIKKEVGGVDVLINNAGFSSCQTLLNGTTAQWRAIMDVNVIALSLCTKLAITNMRERGVDDGHIIHISSIAGHYVFPNMPIFNFYTATKHAVQALAAGLRNELIALDSNIRVTTICPGIVETDFFNRMLPAKENQAMKNFNKSFKALIPKDVADSVSYALLAPAHVQISDLIIVPVEVKTYPNMTPQE